MLEYVLKMDQAVLRYLPAMHIKTLREGTNNLLVISKVISFKLKN